MLPLMRVMQVMRREQRFALAVQVSDAVADGPLNQGFG